MNTRMIINLTIAAALVSVLASCAPSASNPSSQSFSSTDEASNSNIIGGVSSSLSYEKQNGIVGLLRITQDSSGQQSTAICTGSLIQKNIVVTAAHCITLQPGQQLVGALIFFGTDLDAIMSEMDRRDLSHVRVIDKAIRHEAYLRGTGTNNDIALVRIKDAAPSDFQLAQLAPASMARTLRKGSLVTLAGFGVSSYSVDPKTQQAQGSGEGLLRQIGGISVLSITPAAQEITLDQSKGSGACHGDSGGPAYFADPVSKKTYVIGVTSRGVGSVLCDRQVIYTGIMGYSQWIADNSKKILM